MWSVSQYLVSKKKYIKQENFGKKEKENEKDKKKKKNEGGVGWRGREKEEERRYGGLDLA